MSSFNKILSRLPPNRAPWPTKENRQNVLIFLNFSGRHKKCLGWLQMGPGVLCPTNPDPANILGRTDLDFENYIFLIFWIPNFQISRFQISKFPEIWLGPGLGRTALGWAWARLPGLGRAWARLGRALALGRAVGPLAGEPLGGAPRVGPRMGQTNKGRTNQRMAYVFPNCCLPSCSVC